MAPYNQRRDSPHPRKYSAVSGYPPTKHLFQILFSLDPGSFLGDGVERAFLREPLTTRVQY